MVPRVSSGLRDLDRKITVKNRRTYRLMDTTALRVWEASISAPTMVEEGPEPVWG